VTWPKLSKGALLVAAAVVLISGGSAAGWFVLQPETTSASATTTQASAGPTGTQPASGPRAKADVRAAFRTFFDASTPLAAKERALEHGRSFASALRTLSASGLSSEAAARVLTVSIRPGGTAAVAYDVLVGGQVALGHQHGTAVRQSGHWVVSDQTFCALAGLEGSHPPACASGAA
jgi:hypothetical protein